MNLCYDIVTLFTYIFMGIVVPYLMNGTGRLDCSSEDMWPLLPVRTLSDVQLHDISMINWNV
jgi:hypothetical protein